MGRLYGGFPRIRYERAGIPSELVRAFPVAALWNYLARRLRFPDSVLLDEPRWIGNWVARQKGLGPVVVANGTAHRFLFPKIKDTGRLLILERGSTHPENIYLKVQQARKEAGLSHSFVLPEKVTDEMEKTYLADFILAGSEVIKNSYMERGFPPERILVAPYGVDVTRFSPGEETKIRTGPIRLGVVGIIGFRKGVRRALLIGEWARKRGTELEIHFVGPVADPDCVPIIHGSPAKCVMHGVQKGDALLNLFRSCDAVCLPSYEEGFGVSVLEGMSAGLPAIVSREVGASEAIEPKINGVVLNSFDDDELDRELGGILDDREGLVRMGRAARETVLERFKTEDSIQRIQGAFVRMLDGYGNQ